MRLAARSRARSARARPGSTRSSRRLRWRCHVLGIANLVAELALGAVGGRLPDREVRHEVVGRRAVPVPLAGRRANGVAGVDLDDLAAARLDAPEAFRDVDGLANRMAVPGIAGAGREAD